MEKEIRALETALKAGKVIVTEDYVYVYIDTFLATITNPNHSRGLHLLEVTGMIDDMLLAIMSEGYEIVELIN